MNRMSGSVTSVHGPAQPQASVPPPGQLGLRMSLNPTPSWTVRPSVGHGATSPYTESVVMHAQLLHASAQDGGTPAQVHAGETPQGNVQLPAKVMAIIPLDALAQSSMKEIWLKSALFAVPRLTMVSPLNGPLGHQLQVVSSHSRIVRFASGASIQLGKRIGPSVLGWEPMSWMQSALAPPGSAS